MTPLIRSVFTDEMINFLEIDSPKKYIVFGSNTQGRHGAGLAQLCFAHFGAKYGVPTGFQGNSYAIITTDLEKRLILR
jgi:hypothetical protein